MKQYFTDYFRNSTTHINEINYTHICHRRVNVNLIQMVCLATIQILVKNKRTTKNDSTNLRSLEL